MQVNTDRSPPSTIRCASSSVGIPQMGKIGVRPVPASFCSRYFRTSSRKRSPNATCVNPSATACATATRMRSSYCSFVQGQGSCTVRSGTPAASACASSNRRRTACIATRSNCSFIVVSNPPISTDGSCFSTCSIHALSFPELHDTSVFILSTFYFLLFTYERVRMEDFGHPTHGRGDPRPWIHHAVASKLMDPLVPDGRNRRKRFPCSEITAAGARCIDTNFDDDLWRARHRELARRLNALALNVGKDVRPTRSLEHVVKESDATTRVNASKRFGVTPEHEQRARPRPSSDPFFDVRNLRFDAVGKRRALLCVADARAELANCRGDVRQTGVLVQEHRNPGALELRTEIVLRSVHDHEVGLQRDDALHIGIDEAAHLRACQRLWRIPVEIADADNARPCPDGKQHLGGGGD